MSENVGSVMQQAKSKAIRGLVMLFSVLVYVAGVIYAEVHGYALLSRGVDSDMILWATVGIIALGITALALPLGIHYSFHSPTQRYAAFAFYAIDLGLLFFNAISDYATRTHGELPTWLSGYMLYIMPATPIIAAVGWSLLWLLDPGQKERAMIETLKASTREALALRVAEQAKSVDVSEAVDAAAAQMARDIIHGTLGASTAQTTRQRLPAETIDLQPHPNGNGKVKHTRSVIFAPILKRGKSAYNAETVTPVPFDKEQ